jgi:hypothetical protein
MVLYIEKERERERETLLFLDDDGGDVIDLSFKDIQENKKNLILVFSDWALYSQVHRHWGLFNSTVYFSLLFFVFFFFFNFQFIS